MENVVTVIEVALHSPFIVFVLFMLVSMCAILVHTRPGN